MRLLALILPIFIAQIVATPAPETPADVLARFDASTLTPLTGEPFTLSLIVSLPEGAFIVEWPEIGGTWGPFEIRAAGEVIQDGADVRQDFTAVLWRPEDVATPEVIIGYGAGSSAVRRVPVRRLIFSVPTVLGADDSEPRAALPPYFTAWPFPALIALAGAVLAVGVLLAARRPQAKPVNPPTPAQITLNKLRAATKHPPETRFNLTLTLLRDLHARTPHDALASTIATGEALAYAGGGFDAAEAEAFSEMALRAVWEAARE